MSKYNLNDKSFRLLENSDHGAVSDRTTFHYTQEDEIVTATYQGGGVMDGQILAKWQSEDQLEMRYHCVMNDHSLKAGQAIAKVLLNKQGLLELHLDWKWFGIQAEKGHSIYIEVDTKTK